MQTVAVFFPIYDLYEHKRKHLLFERTCDPERPNSSGMGALDKLLEEDPSGLEAFSATYDYSAENIVFLRRVRDWKRLWKTLAEGQSRQEIAEDTVRTLFSEAQKVFFFCVYRKSVTININLESKLYFKLENMFNPTGTAVDIDVICPWDAYEGTLTNCAASSKSENSKAITAVDTMGLGSMYSDDYTTGFMGTQLNGESQADVHLNPASTEGPIPAEFDYEVFDKAAKSIKLLVYQNTWPRYV